MKTEFCRGMRVLAGLGLLLASAGMAQAVGLKVLAGHVPTAIARLNLKPIGNLPATNRLRLAIGLPLRNPAELTNLLRQLSDPASPHYRHYLTPEQFATQFGPSEQDYRAVIAFAQANGLSVSGTYSNRLLVDVTGTVSNIQNAFHVRLRLYHHPKENRTFYAPDVEPSVPSGLPVLNISGLNNYTLPHPMLTMTPISQLNSAKPSAGSGPYGLYMGYDFRNAYVPGVSLTGTGQTVGLLEFDGFYSNDITAYVNQAGLPSVPLQVVPVDGGVSTPGFGNGEVALDIDMVNAMAPGLSKIVVFEAPNPSPWVDILNAMAADSSIKQLSSSWGGGPPNPSAEQIFQEMAAQGQSFFNASGDSDAFTSSIPFPSDSPNITEVGGTTLTMDGAGASYSSETVWNWDIEYGPAADGIGSCGGVSPTYPIPSWQQGIDMSANQGSTAMRNVPDVAMTADNIYIVADNGQAEMVGGTSAAAPLWAGFIALVNHKAAAAGRPPVGFINPAIYSIAKGSSYASDFHDITTGNNTWSGSPGKYYAVAGYDLCTGLGTPNGLSLINALVGKRTGILQITVNPPSGSALLQTNVQPIVVSVNDVYGVTNATVQAFVTNNAGVQIAALTNFVNNGQGNYSNFFLVPSAAFNPLTLTVRATAPGEIGITNMVNYSIVAPPPNDNFADATKIPAGGSSYVENNQFATIETNEPYHDGDLNRAASLWWSWTPAANTNVFISTVGSKVDNVLAVYTGSSLVSLQPVAATNSALASSKPAQMNFNVHGGVTYHVALAGASSNSLGTVALHLTPGGHPDTNAPLVFISYPQSGLTVFTPFLTVLGTAADPGANASGIDRVFVTAGNVRLTAVGTTNWSSPVPLQPGLNFIKASAVDQSGNISPTTTIQVNYLVQGPANDYFAKAIPLTGTSGTVLATNTAATKEVGEPNPAGNPGGKSLWWSFTPPANGVLTLNTSNSSFDTIMGLYTGTNVAHLTTIVDNDDAYSGAPGGFSYISQAIRSNQKYYVLVDGYDGASGTMSLHYSFASVPVYRLTTTISGAGGVQLQTTNTLGGVVTLPSASADFASGATVALTALPDHNDQFDIWSGGVNSMSNPLTVTMNGNLNVTANFVSRAFTDGFESGDLSRLSWTTAGDAPWFVQSNIVDVGDYAAQSGAITDSQSSSLILTTNFVAGTGSFDFKVSSEQNWDFLNFYVDGVLLQQWSGEVGWANYSFPLTSGTHTLEWTYAKDATISLGRDAAFLDDVDLPIALAPSVATTAQIQLQQETGGGLFMNLSGQSGQQYVVQSSSDLVHWRNISTNIAYSGFIRIPLPSSPTNHAQFYRAVAP